MAHQIVFLDYTFLFDPSETFQHLHQFEKALADFLLERGFEAELVQSVSGGSPVTAVVDRPVLTGKRVLHIKKKQEIAPPPLPSKSKKSFSKENPRTKLPRMRVRKKFKKPKVLEKSRISGLKFRRGKKLSDEM